MYPAQYVIQRDNKDFSRRIRVVFMYELLFSIHLIFTIHVLKRYQVHLYIYFYYQYMYSNFST